jgi:hypothetical protein
MRDHWLQTKNIEKVSANCGELRPRLTADLATCVENKISKRFSLRISWNHKYLKLWKKEKNGPAADTQGG